MISAHLNEQLQLLKKLLGNLTIEQYQYQSKYLGNATIGGHTRHIIEILQCLITAYKNDSVVDYINRTRNLEIEKNIILANKLVDEYVCLPALPDKKLVIFADEEQTIIATSFYREIQYNVEHIIHHLALIKVVLTELDISTIDENFGIAYSTIKYKKNLTS